VSHKDLHDLFTELAEDVVPSRTAATALTEAFRVRRRRRAIAGAALAVVVVVAATVALWRPFGGARVESSASTTPPSRAGSARVTHLPAAIARDPQAAPYWPPAIDPDATAISRSAAPISHASLLYTPSSNAGAPYIPIYAYGEGLINGGSGNGQFYWVVLEVKLVETRDADGNRALPLDQGSLGPMGQRAAFAQPDEVVVVDLRTGKEDRIPLLGLNEEVTWLVDGRHVLVSSATLTWLVNVDTRTALPASTDGFTVTPMVGGGSGLTTLAFVDPGDAAPLLRFYDDGGLSWRSHRYVNIASAAPYRFSYLMPHGWRYGDLIAQAGGGQAGSVPGEFVVVIDDQTGDITQVLDLGPNRNKGCCAVVGWMNPDAVIIHTDQEGLLQWTLSTGTVTRLTDRLPGASSLPMNGCDWRILNAACVT